MELPRNVGLHRAYGKYSASAPYTPSDHVKCAVTSITSMTMRPHGPPLGLLDLDFHSRYPRRWRVFDAQSLLWDVITLLRTGAFWTSGSTD